MHKVTIRATEVEKTFAWAALFGEEVAAMERLRRHADNVPLSDGWRARVPSLLAVEESRATIVMERARGETLLRLLESPELVPWRQIGEAIGAFHASASAAGAAPHGDMSVLNVVVELRLREIWFIDPARSSPTPSVWDDVLLLLWALFHRGLMRGLGLRRATDLLAGWRSRFGRVVQATEAYRSWPQVRTTLQRRHGRRPATVQACAYWIFRYLWLPAVLAAASRRRD